MLSWHNVQYCATKNEKKKSREESIDVNCGYAERSTSSHHQLYLFYFRSNFKFSSHIRIGCCCCLLHFLCKLHFKWKCFHDQTRNCYRISISMYAFYTKREGDEYFIFSFHFAVTMMRCFFSILFRRNENPVSVAYKTILIDNIAIEWEHERQWLSKTLKRSNYPMIHHLKHVRRVHIHS